MSSDQQLNILDVFISSTDDLDRVFNVSKLLREHFARSMDSAIKLSGVSNSQKQVLTNNRTVLERVRDGSINQAESEIMEILYRFAIASIVSTSEQLLKSAFEGLVAGNLAKLSRPESFSLTLSDLKSVGFRTDERFWSQQIINDLHGSKNPQEKLNFQNLKAVENLFKEYFGIDFNSVERYPDMAREIHLYYQIRHILAHNGGYIDDRFIKNLDKAGIPTQKYKKGEMVDLTEQDYTNCKGAFTKFFEMIEALIRKAELSVFETD